MSFGDHLEELRRRLFKAIIGLVLCIGVTLYFGSTVVSAVRAPIDNALKKHNLIDEETEDLGSTDIVNYIRVFFGGEDKYFEAKEKYATKIRKQKERELLEKEDPETIVPVIFKKDLVDAFRKAFPEKAIDFPKTDSDEPIEIPLHSPAFKDLHQVVEQSKQTVSLNVQEAFLTYLKVALVTGFVFASPWVFYQLWQFVAAGLFPHEKKYVYIYLPFSLALFIGGAVFCFLAVIPLVIDFLLGFNTWLNVAPQIRLSEWISFAIMLPLMFGISFQLPLVMMFLERISIFSVEVYRQKRRIAILVISILSMLLTPSDPASMLLMMFPLILLYELGIFICVWQSREKQPVAT